MTWKPGVGIARFDCIFNQSNQPTSLKLSMATSRSYFEVWRHKNKNNWTKIGTRSLTTSESLCVCCLKISYIHTFTQYKKDYSKLLVRINGDIHISRRPKLRHGCKSSVPRTNFRLVQSAAKLFKNLGFFSALIAIFYHLMLLINSIEIKDHEKIFIPLNKQH